MSDTTLPANGALSPLPSEQGEMGDMDANGILDPREIIAVMHDEDATGEKERLKKQLNLHLPNSNSPYATLNAVAIQVAQKLKDSGWNVTSEDDCQGNTSQECTTFNVFANQLPSILGVATKGSNAIPLSSGYNKRGVEGYFNQVYDGVLRFEMPSLKMLMDNVNFNPQQLREIEQASGEVVHGLNQLIEEQKEPRQKKPGITLET